MSSYPRTSYPSVFLVRTFHVNMTPYFVGVQWRTVGDITGSWRKVRQIRFGLYWWHAGVTFIA